MTEEKQRVSQQGGGNMPDDLLTIGEATSYLAVNRNTILLYALKGKLPYKQTVGGVKLFRREDLDAILPSVIANRREPGNRQKKEEDQ